MDQENGAKLIWLNVIEVQNLHRSSSESRTTSFKVFWEPFQYHKDEKKDSKIRLHATIDLKISKSISFAPKMLFIYYNIHQKRGEKNKNRCKIEPLPTDFEPIL